MQTESSLPTVLLQYGNSNSRLCSRRNKKFFPEMVNVWKHALFAKKKFQLKANMQFIAEHWIIISKRDTVTILNCFGMNVTELS